MLTLSTYTDGKHLTYIVQKSIIYDNFTPESYNVCNNNNKQITTIVIVFEPNPGLCRKKLSTLCKV